MTTKFNSILLSNKNNYKIIDDGEFVDETAFLNKIANCLNTGVDVLELKFKNLSSKDIMSVCKKSRELCSYFGALMLIFDRVDIAKLVEADGVVLDAKSIAPVDAKKLVENTLLIGFESFADDRSVNLEDKDVDFIVSKKLHNDLTKKVFVLNDFE